MVLGGPPCQKYSACTPDSTRYSQLWKSERTEVAKLYPLLQQRAAKQRELLNLKGMLHMLATGEVVLAELRQTLEDLAAAERAVSQIDQQVKEQEGRCSALAQRAKDQLLSVTTEVIDADAVVKAFIKMFKLVEAVAHAVDKPCFLFMENPFSNRDRALWNRWARNTAMAAAECNQGSH